MFYSEQLLSKTGPLARVWLASNVERKLSKSQILQSDIQSSVGAIVDQGQAPMALRLSGQLMLGVVRIYGRKARYLLDDCNETLLKIRMTFKKTTNNDLPNQQGVTLDLNLPDVLTVDDLFPSLDLSFPMTQTLNIEIDKSQSFNDDWTSSLAPRISTQTRMSPDEAPLLEDDPGLELDLGDDIGFGNNTSMTIEAEVGRNAPAARPDNPSMLFDDNDKPFLDDELPLDIGDDVQMTDAPLNTEYDNPENFFGEDDDGMAPPGDDTFQLANDDARPPRDTDSPLSDAPVDIDGEFADQTAMEETEIAAQQHQRVRKRKLLLPDRETVLHNSQIKAQAEDRSKILRPVQQLPRDPYLLTLMQLQKTGEFVTNIMQDSRSKNWAPELQGLLSFDVVRSMAGAKRKRDSGIADVDSDGEGSAKSPRLELPDDEEEDFAALNDEGVQMGQRDETVFEIPGENALAPEENAMNVMDQEDEDGIFMDNEGGFDETTMPLLHPADAGPVSLGTKHAVHLLREKLGGGPNSSTPQGKRSVLLQELVPEGKTSREEATKMFFEVLVLATKDAVKVEQPGGDTKLGAPLRVRGKRGLWGAWAEMNEALDEAQGEVEMAASG